MRRLRTASSRQLAVILGAIAALALTAAIAQAALTGAGPTPAPKALANAVLDAFNAPEPDGLKAKIHFTNHLLPSGSLPGGAASPLAAGADGRLWVQKSGRFRLELQSDAGDAQIVSDGERLTVYDASSNTVYRVTLPQEAKDATTPNGPDDEKLTLAKVQKVLDELAKTWTVSGARPDLDRGPGELHGQDLAEGRRWPARRRAGRLGRRHRRAAARGGLRAGSVRAGARARGDRRLLRRGVRRRRVRQPAGRRDGQRPQPGRRWRHGRRAARQQAPRRPRRRRGRGRRPARARLRHRRARHARRAAAPHASAS